MKRVVVFCLVIAALLATIACSRIPIERSNGKALVWYDESGSGEPNVTGAERALCDQLRGEVQQTGFFGYACVYPAIDAGKACEDGAECEGFCFAPWDTPSGEWVTGKCSADVNGSSTGNVVENGRARGAMIVD